MEHRLELGDLPRGRWRLSGLVVHHAHLAGGGDIDAVDEAAEQRAVGEFNLDPLFAALRVEAGRVFEPVVAGQQASGLLDQLAPLIVIELVDQLGLRGDHVFPR